MFGLTPLCFGQDFVDQHEAFPITNRARDSELFRALFFDDAKSHSHFSYTKWSTRIHRQNLTMFRFMSRRKLCDLDVQIRFLHKLKVVMKTDLRTIFILVAHQGSTLLQLCCCFVLSQSAIEHDSPRRRLLTLEHRLGFPRTSQPQRGTDPLDEKEQSNQIWFEITVNDALEVGGL